MKKTVFDAILLTLIMMLSCSLMVQILTLDSEKNNELDSNEYNMNSTINENEILMQKLSSTSVILTITVTDQYTNDPISDAEVVVYNATYSTSGLTDLTGVYSTSIEAEWYQFNISVENYYNVSTGSTGVFNPTNNYHYALLPLNGIEITSSNHVLENTNYNLEYSSITTTALLYDYLIYLDTVLIATTSLNTVVLDPMNAGVYNLTVEMNTSLGYFWDQIKLYVIGISFSNPVNGSIVNGGLVPVQFDLVINDPANPVSMNSIQAFVNNTQYIDSTTSDVRTLLLPVFENSSYVLSFIFNIDTLGDLKYNLTIIAQNVIPALDVSVGDYWEYSIREINPNTFIGIHTILNFEVVDKFDAFTVNMTINFTQYDLLTGDFLSAMIGWLVVNTINGYIENTGGNISLPIDTIFIVFTGLNNGYIDFAIFNTFEMVTEKVGESSWNGMKTWLMEPLVSLAPGMTWIEHVDQSTGIIVYLSYYVYALQLNEIVLVKSNYLPVAPKLISNSFTVEQGDQQKILSWNVDGSGSYNIYKDQVLDKSGSWTSGSAIGYDLTNFISGDYNITAEFTNKDGISTVYYTDLHVLPGSAPVLTQYPALNSIINPETDKIIWQIKDDSSGNYYIYKNGSQVKTGSWNPNDQITYDTTSLTPGSYNITLKTTDTTGLTTTSIVIIVISPPSPTITSTIYYTSTVSITPTNTSKTSDGFGIALLALSFFGLLIIKRNRKKLE